MNFYKLKMITLGCFGIFASLQVIATPPLDISKIQPLIAHYMDEYKTPGAEVIIQIDGKNFLYSFGYMDIKKKAPVTHRTLFELGSITKTFIGLLLSEQVLKGNMDLNEYVSPYTDQSSSHSIKNLTPLELATHTSGLPFSVLELPYNAPLSSKYKTVYINFLRTWKSTHTPGMGFMYSNIGFSILGDVLKMRAHLSLSTLVQTDIFKPLAMSSSMLSVTENWNLFYAQGYTLNNIPARTPDEGLLGGAWAIKSSGQDMSYYLNAVIGSQKIPPSMMTAIKMAQTGYFQSTHDKTQFGLGWMITPLDKDTIYERLVHAPAHYNLEIFTPVHKIKNPAYSKRALIDKIGATDGFRTYIGVIPEMKLGIVILTNKSTQNTGALQNLGRKILFILLKEDTNYSSISLNRK